MKLTHELCNEIFKDIPLEVKRAIILLDSELQNAKYKFPKWPNDVIHCAAIVGEEAGELIKASLQFKYEKGRFYDMHREAIQTGAMALRFLTEYDIDSNTEIKKLRKL